MMIAAAAMPASPRTIIRCSRCRRPERFGRAQREQWNFVFSKGVLTGFLCPRCQTPEENAEAEINLATLDYRADAFGRIIVSPKAATA